MNKPPDPFDEFTKKMLAEMRYEFNRFTKETHAIFDEYETKIIKAFEPLLRDLEQRQQERNKYRQSE